MPAYNGIRGYWNEVRVNSNYKSKNAVPQGTELARQWQEGGYRPLARDEYVDMLCAALPRIPSTVVMQRIQADPAPGELLAPAWALEKRGIITDLRRALAARGLWQGCRADATEARPEWFGG